MSERDKDRPRGRASGRAERSRSRSGDRSTTDSRRSDPYSRTMHNPGSIRERRPSREEQDPRLYQGSARDESRGPSGRQPYGEDTRGYGSESRPPFRREDSGRGSFGSSGGYHQGEGGGYDRGGERGGYDRGSDRGGYDRGGYRGGFDRGGDRGGFDRGGDRGGFDRGGDRGGFDRGGDRGGFDRGGFRGGRGGYDRGGGGRGSFGGGRGGGFGGRPEPRERKEAEPIELFTNFFEVNCQPNWILYQYHVDFEPKIESKMLRIGLLKQHENLFSNNKAFDGMTLYSLTRLESEVTKVVSEKRYDSSSVDITIKLVGQILPNSPESIRMFNIVFKRCLTKCKFKEFGRDRAYYDFTNLHELAKYHLKVAAGYKASMDIYGNKLLLCTELAHKLINDTTVLDIMIKHLNDRDGRQNCINFLVGQTVMTNYNNKTYRIDDICWDKKPTDTFPLKKGGEISFENYVLEHYKIRIKDTNQPLLVSMPKRKEMEAGNTAPILLVPELCALTGTVLLKEFERDFNMKKDLDSITKLNPDIRYNRLKQFLEKIKLNPDCRRDLDNWQMNFNDEVVKVNATLLPNITIIFKNDTISGTERGWDKHMRSGHHLSSVPLKDWVLFFMVRDENKAYNFLNELINVSYPMQFPIDKAQMVRLPDTRSVAISFANAIKERVHNSKVQMIVCIVPNSAKDIYDSIKRTCCIDYGVPSQVVTSNILNPMNANKVKSVVTKIAIQMNCKLGGEIWGVIIPMRNIMVVGMDFYKDSSQKNKSVAAFIASINDNPETKAGCTKYFSRCALQNRGEEFTDNLRIFMMDALAKYREKMGILPDKIFVYRDGVSDGQFSGVADFEVPQIKSAFRELEPNYNPKLTVCIVKKRSNARFFLKGDRNDFQNAPMGTVIDNTVTKITGTEFYLISQSTNQGTVSPTHYHVIIDESQMKPERMQNFTFRLTHLYYNWPGQIRVPAQCHYAQKLAHLVGESLHRPHASSLDELLFYL